MSKNRNKTTKKFPEEKNSVPPVEEPKVEVIDSFEALGKDLSSGSKSKWLNWLSVLFKYLSNKIK